MMKYFEELHERLENDEMKLADIPVIAGAIFIVVCVVLGEIGSVILAIGIFFAAIFGVNAATLLWLIPCALLFSICTALIVFGVTFAENNF